MYLDFMNLKRIALAMVVTLVALVPVAAETGQGLFTVDAAAEIGFLDVPYHVITIGEDTDEFDFVREGGQELLFPHKRLWVDVGVGEKQRHFVRLLYQPLTLETVTQFEETRTIDTETFDDGQVVDITYGFDFWRGTYRYRFVDSKAWEVDAGVSLQIRNASIRFIAQEGNSPSDGGDSSVSQDEAVITQDNGPVPILSARVRHTFEAGPWLELDADGFYASSSFFNGAEYPFTGFIWDAAVSAGAPMRDKTEAFLSVRAVGGGGQGTSQEDRQFWTQSLAGGQQRFNDNVLSTVAVALGLRLGL